MSIYPPEVAKRIKSPQNVGVMDGENARGKDASFVCGAFIAFWIGIDAETKTVVDARFRTNGCGYMIAAADCLAETVKGKHLSDLHGLNEDDLRNSVFKALGEFDPGRQHCADCCIRALRSAFADYRARRIEEFRGEKALICTCFGVTEETIEALLSEPGAVATGFFTVEEIGRECNAGTGCGSCRMLIQEMLDTKVGRM